MAREWTIEVAELCPEELADVQLEIFNNTIRWQVGHILTVAERLLFHVPSSSESLSTAFTRWFDSGSKPSDWIGEPPSLTELIFLLKRQRERILAMPPETFDERLDSVPFGFHSLSECAGFVIVHESLHVGKMDEMLRVIKQRGFEVERLRLQ